MPKRAQQVFRYSINILLNFNLILKTDNMTQLEEKMIKFSMRKIVQRFSVEIMENKIRCRVFVNISKNFQPFLNFISSVSTWSQEEFYSSAIY